MANHWPNRFFLAIASIFCSIAATVAALVERTFVDDFPPPLIDARTSIELDVVAQEVRAVEPDDRSRFLSFLDRARSHTLFAGDGFAYG